jgi:hypothetical protein
VKRNARASMAMQKWLRFPCKEESYGQVAYVGVADIHHHVLKSTTSDGGRMGDAQNRRSIWSISSVWFIWLVLSAQIDQKDQTDQIDQTNRELPFSLTLGYSHKKMRLERV